MSKSPSANPRRRPTPTQRRTVEARAGGVCEYCRCLRRYVPQPFNVEHIIPFARGGKTEIANLAWACAGCNYYDHDKLTALDPLTNRRVRLFNPRRQRWKEHFTWSTDATLMVGLPAVTGPLDQVLDSLPIMLAVRGRSPHAKVARDQANKGYCDSKKLWYQGLKLHLIGIKQYQQLPLPLCLCFSPASQHELPPLKEGTLVPLPGTLFGDKAYRDQSTAPQLAAQGTTLCTPDKKEKGQTLYQVGQSSLWSRFVSAMRQPIESIFNWLIEKTGIQTASKARSSEGLMVHCYGKLTAAFY